MKKILLVDTFGLIFRSYYAFITHPLTNNSGKNISAVHGFFNALFSLLKKEKPDFVLLALEGKGKCFRYDIYPEYKANRQDTPEDLKEQIGKITALINKMEIPYFSQEGFEADDVIGTLTEVYSKNENYEVWIFSSDKDLRQLVKNNVKLCRPDPKTGEYILYGRDEIFADMGVYPEQVADYLAITGDKSDNIPGIKGLGEKGAAALLGKWQSLENIYEHLTEITPPNMQKKLTADKENALLSQKLTTIRTDVPLQLNENSLYSRPINLEAVLEDLEKDNLRTVISQIKTYNKERFQITFSHADEKAELNAKKFHFVPTLAKLEELANKIRSVKKFAYDLETTNFDFSNGQLICMSIAIPGENNEPETFVIPFTLSLSQLTEAGISHLPQETEIIKILAPLFTDKSILKIGHNIKFDNKFLYRFGITDIAPLFDTMLAEYCLDCASSVLALKDMAEHYLNVKVIHYEDVVPQPRKKTLLDAPFDKLFAYSGQDAYLTLQLHQLFDDKISQDSQQIHLFYEIEIPLVQVLSDMEITGIYVNADHLHELSNKMDNEIAVLREKMFDIVSYEFNPNSPVQLRKLLFEDLGLQPDRKTKSGASTDVEVLKKLRFFHPLPGLLLDYRAYSKIKSTYTENLIDMINPQTGRIHTTYFQTGTQTGRLSSKDPNLQNIPIRSPIGREIRRAFIPRKGWKLMSADYSQIEIFLLAEFSDDRILQNAIMNGEDIHAGTAAILFDKQPAAVSKEERMIAKTVNFGILYGQSAFGLANELQISRTQAALFIEKYFKNYSGVKCYIEKLKDLCRKNGYSSTHWGRHRTIREINEKNKNIRENGERMAVNSVIQGTAADLIKQAMIRAASEIKKQRLKSKLLLQVHDELIFEVPPEELEIMKNIVRNVMECGYGFNLPLKASIEIGDTWGEMH
ncbi:MAG: DNA polymerase I [Spirochaetales bacterium]|nr:DNA polymerase I [Spirochaetales bacterium]